MRRLFALALSLVVTAAFGSKPAPVGPEVRAFVFHSKHPEIVYAATRAGVFMSSDYGSTWIRTMGVGIVWAMIARPDQPNVFFAGVEGSKFGMLRSRDAGQSWDPVPTFTGKTVWALAIDPRRPEIMFAVTSPNFGERGRHLYRSQDGGSNWNLILRGREITVGGVAIGSDGTVYVGLVGEILRSSNLGETWTASKVVVDGRSPYIQELTIDSTDPQRLYSRSTLGLIETSDGGATWAIVGDPMCLRYPPSSHRGSRFAICGEAQAARTSGGGLVHLRVSTDGGKTWTRVGAGLPRTWSAIDIASHPANAGLVFASWANGGVYKSKDGGMTWTAACGGITWEDVGVSRAGMQDCKD